MILFRLRLLEHIREQDPLKQGLKLQGLTMSEYLVYDSRARSIKTRIETTSIPLHIPKHRLIREQDPLKQGLKPYVHPFGATSDTHSRARSIKTRIETNSMQFSADDCYIREQDPLKQGLKHMLDKMTPIMENNSRARSIKTRIETDCVRNLWNGFGRFASKIH